MIKDLQDSKRIDSFVHSERQKKMILTLEDEEEEGDGKNLHATIVSRLFWPSFQSQPLKLPGRLGRFVLFLSLSLSLDLLLYSELMVRHTDSKKNTNQLIRNSNRIRN